MSDPKPAVFKNELITLINTARAILILCVLILIQFQPEINLIPLEILAIIASVYAVILLVFPFDRIKSKALGFIIGLLDIILIFSLISFTGELTSPFYVLLFFPLISLSIIYETWGSILAVVMFTLYFLYYFQMDYLQIIGAQQAHVSSFKQMTADLDLLRENMSDLLIRMSLMSLTALYLGNIGKQVKGRERIRELEAELADRQSKP